MSMEDLKKAFSLIETKFDEKELDFCCSISETTLERAQQVLNITFPHTYKIFIEKYGCGGIGYCEIYGITQEEDFMRNIPDIAVPNVVWTTLQWHKDYNHPIYLPIIYNLGEGTTYCLDTSQMNEEGECPVVAWPLGGYEQTPVLEVVAEDFGKFFLDMVQQQIEYKNMG